MRRERKGAKANYLNFAQKEITKLEKRQAQSRHTIVVVLYKEEVRLYRVSYVRSRALRRT